MQLKNFLKERKIGVSEMSSMIGVSQSICSMWTNGQRIPSLKNMKKITEWSDGLVTPNDFYLPINDNELPDITA